MFCCCCLTVIFVICVMHLDSPHVPMPLCSNHCDTQGCPALKQTGTLCAVHLPAPPGCIHLLWLGPVLPKRCGARQCLVWTRAVPGKGNMRCAWGDGLPPRPGQSMPVDGNTRWRRPELLQPWCLVCAMCEQRITHGNGGREDRWPSSTGYFCGVRSMSKF